MQNPIWSALSFAAVFGLLDKKSRTDEVGKKSRFNSCGGYMRLRSSNTHMFFMAWVIFS